MNLFKPKRHARISAHGRNEKLKKRPGAYSSKYAALLSDDHGDLAFIGKTVQQNSNNKMNSNKKQWPTTLAYGQDAPTKPRRRYYKMNCCGNCALTLVLNVYKLEPISWFLTIDFSRFSGFHFLEFMLSVVTGLQYIMVDDYYLHACSFNRCFFSLSIFIKKDIVSFWKPD